MMLNEGNLPKYFWADAISTTCYVLNRILVCPILNKPPYELLRGRKPNVSHLHVFGCKCFILNNGKDNLGKFDAKAGEGIFLGYSQSSKAYTVYNKRLLIIEESVHVSFDESFVKHVGKGMSFYDIGVSSHDILNEIDKGIDQPQMDENEKVEDDDHEEEKEESPAEVDNLPLSWKTSKGHSIDNILGDITRGVTIRSKISNFCHHFTFVSHIEPKNANDALLDEYWLMERQDELNQFERNEI